MIKHILVPLDSSERSELAIPYALQIARLGTKISLLYVLEIPMTPFLVSPSPPVLPQETELYHSFRIRHIEKAEAYLKKTTDALSAQPADIEGKLITGNNPAEHILEFAEEYTVDLIVMSTRGHSGISRWIMGSVTQKVLQVSPCPVLVVPSRDQ